MWSHTKRLGVFVAVLCAAAWLVTFTGTEAIAQIRAALVKNVDEPGRQPYEAYVEFTQSNCSFGGCSTFNNFGGTVLFDLAPVPAGKRWVIQHVSGRIPSNTSADAHVGLQTQQIISFQLVKWAFGGPFQPQFGTTQFFSTPTFVTVGPGEAPHVHVFLPSGNNVVGFLSFSGYLIDSTN